MKFFMSYVMENYVTTSFHNTFYAYNSNIFVSVCKNIDIIINHIKNF